MTSFISEIGRFLAMVSMLFNMCNQSPETRKACLSDWDQWLYPALQEAWDIKTQTRVPYQEEKEQLK